MGGYDDEIVVRVNDEPENTPPSHDYQQSMQTIWENCEELMSQLSTEK
jgi:hypothetical protein